MLAVDTNVGQLGCDGQNGTAPEDCDLGAALANLAKIVELGLHGFALTLRRRKQRQRVAACNAIANAVTRCSVYDLGDPSARHTGQCNGGLISHTSGALQNCPDGSHCAAGIQQVAPGESHALPTD